MQLRYVNGVLLYFIIVNYDLVYSYEHVSLVARNVMYAPPQWTQMQFRHFNHIVMSTPTLSFGAKYVINTAVSSTLAESIYQST